MQLLHEKVQKMLVMRIDNTRCMNRTFPNIASTGSTSVYHRELRASPRGRGQSDRGGQWSSDAAEDHGEVSSRSRWISDLSELRIRGVECVLRRLPSALRPSRSLNRTTSQINHLGFLPTQSLDRYGQCVVNVFPFASWRHQACVLQHLKVVRDSHNFQFHELGNISDTQLALTQQIDDPEPDRVTQSFEP